MGAGGTGRRGGRGRLCDKSLLCSDAGVAID